MSNKAALEITPIRLRIPLSGDPTFPFSLLVLGLKPSAIVLAGPSNLIELDRSQTITDYQLFKL